MKQHDFAFKWLLYVLSTVIFLALQSLLLNHIQISGVHPFLPPIIVAIVVSLEGFSGSIGYAVLFGLYCDLTINAVIPCFYTLCFFIVTFLISISASKLVMPGIATSFLHGITAIVITDFFQILFLAASRRVSFWGALQLTGKELLFSVVFAPLVYVLMRKVHKITTFN